MGTAVTLSRGIARSIEEGSDALSESSGILAVPGKPRKGSLGIHANSHRTIDALNLDARAKPDSWLPLHLGL